jgi:hypothetical protein
VPQFSLGAARWGRAQGEAGSAANTGHGTSHWRKAGRGGAQDRGDPRNSRNGVESGGGGGWASIFISRLI